jgi:nucleotide-binding universal stress UspA family protein
VAQTLYKTIMIPLDGSSASEIALPYAEEIAVKTAADIILVSVSEPAAAEADQLYSAYLKSVEEKVSRRVQEWGTGKRPRVTSGVLVGNPSSEILRYADETNVDLIVMASRGRSTRGPWLLGNIAAKVLRATSKPVLLVKVAADSTAVLQKNLIRRILLPLDGSKMGEQAIPHAESLIQALGAQAVLIQALEPLKEIKGEGYRGYPVLSEAELRVLNERRREFARAYLDGMSNAFKEKGLRASITVLRGSPADQILEYARANAIDLIAMSTHGRSGVGIWVFGSVTDKLLHAGDTAVLVVRATPT